LHFPRWGKKGHRHGTAKKKFFFFQAENAIVCATQKVHVEDHLWSTPGFAAHRFFEMHHVAVDLPTTLVKSVLSSDKRHFETKRDARSRIYL
jgi:hypothetical protein